MSVPGEGQAPPGRSTGAQATVTPKPLPSKAMMRAALDALFGPDDVVELRAFPKGGQRRIAAGYFDGEHRKDLIEEAYRLNRAGALCYVTLNRINSQLLGRYRNRVEEFSKTTTSDRDAVCRRHLLLDFDAPRPTDTAATQAQVDAACERGRACAEHLRKQGWPDPIVVHSGNGLHLIYPIDLPNNEASALLVKGALGGLAAMFDDDEVKIDESVYNASRITKLPGSVSCKGDHDALTPWRLAELVEVPARGAVVTEAQLEALQPVYKGNGRAYSTTGFDLPAFLRRLEEKTGITYDLDEYQGGGRYKLSCCPFDSSHSNKGGAAILQKPSGKLGFVCQHESCRKTKHWQELRELVDGPRDTEHKFTDLGNAHRFVRDHGADVRYCWPWRRWLVWNGRYWSRDDSGAIHRLAEATVRRMYEEAAGSSSQERREALAKWAVKCEAHDQRTKMLASAQAIADIPILPGNLDWDPWLLNVRNGTIDLRTGTLRQHARSDYLSRCMNHVDFDPNAECPTWDRFLSEVFGSNAELISFVQRAIGYSFTGVIIEHVLLVLYGLGANGKTTLIDALHDLLGPYAVHAPPELLLMRRGEHHPTELALLYGARLVTASESGEDRRLAEALVKSLTGGDPITARRMREDFWEFPPQFTLWAATNYKPQIRGTDHAIWRRIRLIPFDVTFYAPETGKTPQQDPTLPARLREEASGTYGSVGCPRYTCLTPPLSP
jgi:P4 family phage/plasmid primase-like protien